MFVRTVSLLALVFVLAAPAIHAATWTTIDPPGSVATEVFGENSVGQLVGMFIIGSSVHGFLLSNGTFTQIDAPGGLKTICTGINDSGQIVGYYLDSEFFIFHGFVMTGSTFQTIDPPGSAATETGKINNAGEVVGYFDDAIGTMHGFKWSSGVYTVIDFGDGAAFTVALGINSTDDITGHALAESRDLGFRLTQGTFHTIIYPGSDYTVAYAINDLKQIVGWVYPVQRRTVGFLYSGGKFTVLQYPGSISTEAYDIDQNGNVVGEYQDGAGVFHGFLRSR